MPRACGDPGVRAAAQPEPAADRRPGGRDPRPGGGGGARRRRRRTGRTPRPATDARRRAAADDPRPAAAAESAPPDGPDRSLGSAGGESDDTALGPHRQPPSAGPSGRQSLTVTDVRRLWPEVLEEVKGRRRFTWILLSQNAQVVETSATASWCWRWPVSGPRDSFAKGGSEDILREALNEALGVDFRIEAIVDPSVTSGSRASGGGGSVRGGGQRVPAGLADSDAPPPDSEPPEETGEPVVATGGRPRSEAVLQRPAGRRIRAGRLVRGGRRSRCPWAPGPAPEGEGSAGAPADRPSVDPRWREQARQHIRPTRQGPAQAEGGSEDLRDEAASINDSDIEDQEESHTELLARQLGAEIIGEEKHGF